jgi:hypothetical protein
VEGGGRSEVRKLKEKGGEKKKGTTERQREHEGQHTRSLRR